MIKYMNEQSRIRMICNDFKNGYISKSELMGKLFPIIDTVFEQEIKEEYDFSKFANIESFGKGLTDNNKSDIIK